MTNHWDEISKSLTDESLPRRESLRRLGFLFAGAVLSPLGVGTAWARGADPCKTFCKCRSKSQQNACLAACNACSGATSRLCGSCGTYACTDIAIDFNNCGACGYVCEQPGPYEYGACLNGRCEYTCAEGAVYCDGTCTFLGWDHYNCGACGNVCPESAPFCDGGACSCPADFALCGGKCVSLSGDPNNCGACGNVCPGTQAYCAQGLCAECDPGLTLCGYNCIDLNWNEFNCGACGNACTGSEYCGGGSARGSALAVETTGTDGR